MPSFNVGKCCTLLVLITPEPEIQWRDVRRMWSPRNCKISWDVSIIKLPFQKFSNCCGYGWRGTILHIQFWWRHFFAAMKELQNAATLLYTEHLWVSMLSYLWKWPPRKSTDHQRMCLRRQCLLTVILASCKCVGGWCHFVWIFIRGPLNAVLEFTFSV